jgi:predicted secreted protein
MSCKCLTGGLFAMVLTVWAGDEDKARVLTDKDNDAKIKVIKGSMLVVKLEATPTAGYTWQIVKNNPEHLTLQGKSQIIPAKKGVVGGKATQVFRFKAEGPAFASELELVYRRPFEKDKPPEKTFKVQVEIERE